jgi:hypothetical protein
MADTASEGRALPHRRPGRASATSPGCMLILALIVALLLAPGVASAAATPVDLTPPRILPLYRGAPALPVLVGNRYAVATGRWRVPRGSRLTVEWLNARGRVASRVLGFEVGAGELGKPLTARVCAVGSGTRACRLARLSGAVRTVASYLQATCGSRRPPAPAYDPDFAFFSAPHAEYGWNPCKPIVWALDTYDMPALRGAPAATWEALTSQAIAQLAAATGATFVRAPNFYAAPGLPNEGTVGPAGVALAIGFAPQGPDVGGTGGLHDVAGQFATMGEVEVSTGAAFAEPQALLVLLHELGHAMGLAHPVAEPPAPDPLNAVMDPAISPFTAYQPGDLCGLYELTWRLPCAGASAVTLGQGVVKG